MGHGCHGKEAKSLIVIDVAFFYDTAVPVARIFAHAYVGYHIQFGHGILYSFNSVLDHTFVVISGGAEFVFSFRNTEEQYRRNAERMHFFCMADQDINRFLVAAGHRGNLFFDTPAVSCK